MKKIVFTLIIALAVTAMFVSCDANSKVASSDTVEVMLAPALEKNLTSDVNKEIKYWEFMARPDFTLAAGEYVYGVVSYWKALPAIDNRTGAQDLDPILTNIGRYTSGSWYFEVRALNSNHKVIALGQTRQILRDGLDNTVNVVMYTDRADGTHGESADATSRVTGSTEISPFGGEGITLSTNTNYGTGNGELQTTQYGAVKAGFIINRLDDSISNIRMSVYSQKVSKTNVAGETQTEVAATASNAWTVVEAGQAIPSWYVTKTGVGANVGQAKVYYQCDIPNRDAGPYIYTFVVEGKNLDGDWIVLGGQALDVLIVGGETTYVTGTLLPNEYVVGGLKITAPGYIVGTINNAEYVRGTAGTPVTLTYQRNASQSAEVAVKYYWYVNGVQQENTTGTLTFDCPKDSSNNYLYGIYRISCSPTGALGSIGNSTIDVIFNPADGPNVGEFDWASLGL